jgi:hypothetical protein
MNTCPHIEIPLDTLSYLVAYLAPCPDFLQTWVLVLSPSYLGILHLFGLAAWHLTYYLQPE